MYIWYIYISDDADEKLRCKQERVMSLFFLELQQTNIPTPQNVTPPLFPPNKKKNSKYSQVENFASSKVFYFIFFFKY